ncbi:MULTISPECIES: acyl-ACP--UDP-N-acetylglucosamine O-acyltransferase [Legionella]|uniref:Acyl-[acyl-carrier-protein]--UDP-N-acetylglucosamine O-acyltransferase n=1 Tax=Legionella septentrionalis TaxID=2498109 RepID=A0A433JJN1_9GAMM|nr:acyl-ACP--UDP-N-acetylglucosamine O-acyltransferase [Legionella septentrionalis]MCP0913171.1 acyl-ACP--UDP-N-acetylglucosamine O-acyltransferase [Legionella sp. 27cVA30]RUQ88066.1 acyl-ACP--UDP-N-acetylglucosamine O-acyltransferase [Legionella septentrionalis]RUR02445.1 acyl-ACP--UDP-N-acetylglucosamine O-acyltransferase [Legionella septentrionalis]RUR09302.1 acyl-ACP--UDP-N-acetylglucosamine O-acyltransferase [Legionella septentrionalis]RUR17103.1 acyl-ACP--UDP-N-acetylglucosamine O-acyltr
MISENAIIHPSAKLAKGVTVGPGTIIGADVEIGEDTWVGPHVVIQGPTVIGKNNKIFQFASVGDEPQDITYKGEPTRLEIGDNNIIREFCMISRGTVKGGGLTRLGNDNFLMAYTHIGHDCMVGNHVIMVNYSALSGHVIVQDYANIGAYAAVHQFCHIGAYAFIARATYVTKDVLPYVMIAGHSTSACGINTVGLRRRGFSSAAIDCLRRAYKIIFRKGLTVQQAIAELEVLQKDCPEVVPMIDALNQSTRGIVR